MTTSVVVVWCTSGCGYHRVLERLRGLVAMNESLKLQEQQFKTHCQEELGRLKQALADLREEGAREDDERVHALGSKFAADREKLQRIRQLLVRWLGCPPSWGSGQGVELSQVYGTSVYVVCTGWHVCVSRLERTGRSPWSRGSWMRCPLALSCPSTKRGSWSSSTKVGLGLGRSRQGWCGWCM